MAEPDDMGESNNIGERDNMDEPCNLSAFMASSDHSKFCINLSLIYLEAFNSMVCLFY